MRIVEKIKELDVEFKRLTGHEAFGYLAAPTPTSERYAFATGEVFTAGDKAYEYMLELLARCRDRSWPAAVPARPATEPEAGDAEPARVTRRGGLSARTAAVSGGSTRPARPVSFSKAGDT